MAETLSRKDQITQVAKGLFKQHGYAATSMRDLARAIGIEPASLYSHIKGKEELLRDICLGIGEDFHTALDTALESNDPPEVQFRAAIRAHIGVIIDNIDASGVFFVDWRYLTEPNITLFRNLRHDYEQKFRNILRAGIRHGVFRETDIRFTMRMIFSAINGTHEWYKPNGQLDPDDISTQTADFLLRGLMLDPATSTFSNPKPE